MKKWYKSLVIIALVVGLLVCSCFSVSADTGNNGTRILPSGYSTVKYASAWVQKGTDTSYFPNSYNTFPFSANYYGYTGPFYFNFDIDTINVPAGSYIIIEIKSYFSSTTSKEAAYVPVSSREKLLKCSIGYSSSGTPSAFGMAERGHSPNGDCFNTFVVNNDTNGVLSIVALRFGIPTTGALSSAYAYYLNVDYVRYKVLSSDEYALLMNNIETDKITGQIQDSTDQITNGWDPKPERPEGADKVDDVGNLEEQIGENSQAGLDEADKLFDDFAGTLEILYPGLLFITGLFNTMLGEFSFFRSLLLIGLALGIIGFILNLSNTIAGRLRRSDAEREREERQNKGKKGS